MGRRRLRFQFSLILGFLNVAYSALLKATLAQHFFTKAPFSSIKEIHEVSFHTVSRMTKNEYPVPMFQLIHRGHMRLAFASPFDSTYAAFDSRDGLSLSYVYLWDQCRFLGSKSE